MAEILDSGSRCEFKSGAVRDVQEGKGRCDLLPLDMASDFLKCDWTHFDTAGVEPLMALHGFLTKRDPVYALLAAHLFCQKRGWDEATALLEVSKHFEDGAKKYSPRNWEKGIPLSRYVDSGVRHYLKWTRGDDDERHDRAFLWNMFCLAWTVRHRPECDDIKEAEKND